MNTSATPGRVNYAAQLWVILLFCLSLQTASAETGIKGNVINAPARMEESANSAAGSDNKAAHSSIVLKQARVSGAVVNTVQGKAAVNTAAGRGNVARQGSIAISRGTVEGTVQNSAATRSTGNLAVGRDNQANQSSISLETSTAKGTVGNTSMGRNMVNAAAGSRNQANQSTVIVRNSSVGGTLINSAAGSSQTNMAAGTDNNADQGSVRMENSRVRGTVMNSAALQKSSNVAAGSGSSASQAAVVMEGVQARGVVVNTAAGENAVNVAAGARNEANQSSIVVDGGQAGYSSAATLRHDALHVDAGADGREHGTLAYSGGWHDVQEQEGARNVPGQVIFLVDNDRAGLASLDRVARKYQLQVKDKTVLKSLNRIMVVSATARDAAEIAEALKKESGIHNSQPNYVFTTLGEQDPLSPMQNLVSMLELQEVHGKVSGRHVTVAIVDTGVEVEHRDLRSRIVGYENFIADSDYRGEIHGTAVAGIIGAERNEFGIIGIAPEVSLLALRACRQVSGRSAMGECFSTSLVQSLDAAISAGVDVVNLSLGAYVNDTLLSVMIDSGYKQGILFAAPVGNDPAADKIAFPASHDRVISVAGFDELGKPLPNKRLAAMADAVAPATHLFVTTPGSNHNFSDGTSLASAAISGILALSLEKKTARTPPCLPRYNSAVPWPKQVFSCLGL